MQRPTQLTGKQKAAVLLITLGPETAAEVMKHLHDDEIEQLTLEMANVHKVDWKYKDIVLEEFHQVYRAKEYIAKGGIEYARQVLEKALGQQRAMEILNRLTASLQVRPFDFARRADPIQILNFIQNEHPQTIALVLSYLEPQQGSLILSALPPEYQVEVAQRLAVLQSTSPEVLDQVEQALESKLSALSVRDFTPGSGIDSLVKILNGVDRSTEKTILEALEMRAPDLAEEIKKRMFVFEDIAYLDNRSIQRIIRDVDTNDLALALKAASDTVKEAIFRNMSKRMAETFKEDMEYMGPVRLRDVEEAQQRIVAVVRRLEESGEIIIGRGGDDIVV
ncbi:MAG: flagellar motor switch protein FliG [Alicyclobacillaceae bacterium]|nr:flagellar motor switch protein FliG [Alicyclobacillaceae bacterium]